MRDQAQCSPAKLASLRSELTDLRKFVVLNYIAVIKAVKKRNRHLKVTHHGDAVLLLFLKPEQHGLETHRPAMKL